MDHQREQHISQLLHDIKACDEVMPQPASSYADIDYWEEDLSRPSTSKKHVKDNVKQNWDSDSSDSDSEDTFLTSGNNPDSKEGGKRDIDNSRHGNADAERFHGNKKSGHHGNKDEADYPAADKDDEEGREEDEEDVDMPELCNYSEMMNDFEVEFHRHNAANRQSDRRLSGRFGVYLLIFFC